MPSPAENFNFTAFRAIPVLHEGRVKPLDSFARIELKEISGSDAQAVPLLAETLFQPASAIKRPLFLIQSSDLKYRLGLDPAQKYFSFTTVRGALAKQKDIIIGLASSPAGALTPGQNELLRLQERVLTYDRLLQSLSALLPLYIDLPGAYKSNYKTPDYLDLAKNEPALTQKLKAIVKQKGPDPARYTREESKLAELAYALQQIHFGGENNDELRIIPDPKNDYISPWQAALEKTDTETLNTWRDMAHAWHENDAARWNEDAQKLGGKPSFKINLEIFYNHARPFQAALALYIAALAIFLRRNKRAAPAVLAAGVFAHAAGLAARITILGRPPVGTLYEAVLFVSCICAAAGLLIYIRRKNTHPAIAGLLAAIILLVLAPAVLQSGESMEMLVAVLNTSFWLSTHVLCITTGYALGILTACLAHFYLAARALNKKDAILKTLQKNIYGFSLAALLFTAVGTALGGIWADQSWGRFWGWDPKENGALLIVLWLAWIQHGRITKQLSPLTFAATAAALNIVVALAWFGVNLLSVGLHSYGFTTGLATGLSLFCGAEIILIGILLICNIRKDHAA